MSLCCARNQLVGDMKLNFEFLRYKDHRLNDTCTFLFSLLLCTISLNASGKYFVHSDAR